MEMPRQVIVECIHKWSGHSVVESLLDPSCSIFSIPKIQGFIGYHVNRGCATVFGDPVCSPADRDPLVEAFNAFCEKQKKNVVYLVASEEFAHWMQNEYASALINVGEELYLNPQQDPRRLTGKRGISLRGKLRHAETNGISVSEYLGEIPDLEQKIQDVAAQWLKHRCGPQIYISRVRLFTERFGKRWFYAHQGDRLLGGVVLNQLESKGWALDRIMTVPNAPQGTSELLVVSVLEKIAKEGCRFLTFGAINGDILGNISGFGKLTSFMTHHLYKASIKYFNLRGKRKFWDKFYPQSAPTFLVFKKPRLGFHEVTGLMHALNVSLPQKF